MVLTAYLGQLVAKDRFIGTKKTRRSNKKTLLHTVHGRQRYAYYRPVFRSVLKEIFPRVPVVYYYSSKSSMELLQ